LLITPVSNLSLPSHCSQLPQMRARLQLTQALNVCQIELSQQYAS